MNLKLKIILNLLVSNTNLILLVPRFCSIIDQIELGRGIIIYLFLSSFKDASMAIM